MCFEFDYGNYSTDHQFESTEAAIKAAYEDGQVEVVRLISDDENQEYETVWSAEMEADNYNFKDYDRDDIIDDLFMFTDALEDSDVITAVEKHIIAKLKARWKDIGKEG